MPSLESIRRSLSASSWLGVAVVGAAVFLLGVYTPALTRFPYTGELQIAIAAVGGAITVVGLSFWWDQREEEVRHPPRRPLTGRARELSIAPSFAVYRPPAVERPPMPGERDLDDE